MRRAARYFKNECPEPDGDKAEAWMAESDKVMEWAMNNMYNKQGYFYVLSQKPEEQARHERGAPKSASDLEQ